MDDNVTPLPGTFNAELQKVAPNENLIALLEKYLEKAKAGKIRAGAFSFIWDDNATSMAMSTDSTSQVYMLIGLNEEVKYRNLREISCDHAGE